MKSPLTRGFFSSENITNKFSNGFIAKNISNIVLMEEIMFDTSKGVVRLVESTGWDTYFVDLNRSKVGTISRYADGWKFFHINNYSVFSEAEGLILVDIALGKIKPKSIILPVQVILGGKIYQAMRCAPDQWHITKPNGMYEGDLSITIENGHKKWTSLYFKQDICTELGRQLLRYVKSTSL